MLVYCVNVMTYIIALGGTIWPVGQAHYTVMTPHREDTLYGHIVFIVKQFTSITSTLMYNEM